jgi:hypothetical protein
MSSFRQLRSFFITMILAVMLVITIGFDFGTAASWAAITPTQLKHQPQTQIPTLNRAKAVKKNIEGKSQSAIDSITGDLKNQRMGEAKQDVVRNILN